MPMYDWECEDGHRFEAIVLSYDQGQRIPCRVCGKQSQIVLTQGARSGVRFMFNYMGE